MPESRNRRTQLAECLTVEMFQVFAKDFKQLSEKVNCHKMVTDRRRKVSAEEKNTEPLLIVFSVNGNLSFHFLSVNSKLLGIKIR